MTDNTDLLRRLRELAYDKEARLTGTPMIPLHENTIIAIIDAIEALEADNAAIRELMNVYNLGGWTDAIAPMKRALRAEADNAALRKDAERYQWLRNDAEDMGVEADFGTGNYEFIQGERLDAAIGTAMREGKG